MNIKKDAATKLRDAGYSYAVISQQLGIAKSTLSNWFRDRPFTPNDDTLRRVKEGQAKYGLIKKKIRLQETRELREKGYREIGEITKRDLWMVGLGIWLGEGSKTIEQVRLANSDPYIIKIWLRWLREVCGLTDKNISVRMHLYADSNVDQCRAYWQSVTRLPVEAFRKTMIDKRTTKIKTKKGKLPYGTLHISVISNKNPEFGIRFHRRMMGWVSAILNQNRAGVV